MSWPLGALGFAVGVATGMLPTASEVAVSELVWGGVCHGFLASLVFSLAVGLSLHWHEGTWISLLCMSAGSAVGAAVGLAVVREFFGAVWVGPGGALVGWVLGNALSNRLG